MLNNISYFMILGKPLMMYVGILTILLFLIAAYHGAMALKGKGTVKKHMLMVKIAFSAAIVHAVLGILAFF